MACSAESSAFVDRIVEIRHPVRHPDLYTRQVLPDTSANIIFIRRHFQKVLANSDRLKLSGQLTHKKLFQFSTDDQGFILKLKPWVLGSLVRIPTHELINHSIDLEELLPANDFARLEQQLQVSPNSIEPIIHYLDSCLRNPRVDSSILQAIKFIESVHGQVKVNRLARELNTCTRNFERRFKAQTGLTPKQFIRNQRFLWAKSLLASGKPLLDVTHCCGYFDQTHFTKEFKSISGLSPYAFQQDRLSLFY